MYANHHYARHLEELAKQLHSEARGAENRELHGLAELLTAAAESATSWSYGILGIQPDEGKRNRAVA